MTLGDEAKLALWTRSLQIDRPTYVPASRIIAFTRQIFSGNDSLFSVASITRY